MCGKWKAPWYCCLSFSTSKRTVQIRLPEFHQDACFYYYSQYLHTNCGAWEPGEKGLALSSHSALPEPTSQLVSAHHLIEKLYLSAHHLIEKLYSSSFMHRLNSCNQTIDYPFTVVAVVFHQTLWDSPYHFMLSAKSICQCFLSLDTHLTVKVFCQKLNARVFSLPRYARRLCNTRTHTMHRCVSSGNSHFPGIVLWLISVPYLIAPQNSEEIIVQVI